MRLLSLREVDYTSSLAAVLQGRTRVFQNRGGTEVIGRQHDFGVQYAYMLDWANSVSPFPRA